MDDFREDIEKYPELKSDFSWYDMTREEKMEHWWRRNNMVAKIDRKRYFDECHSDRYGFWSFLHIGNNPLTVHLGMFVKCVEFLASEEQSRKWLPRVKALNILGCYAQTELGHGSNVRDLETTATLDMETDEWVLHTPSIRAYKFWPGSMGITANHTVLFARAKVGENDYGVCSFFVQIRDIDTHVLMPGVTAGDLGAKLGYNSVDNGFLAFDQVRIPRTDMLSRFSSVAKDGSFELNGDPRLLYNIMVQTRMDIIRGCGFKLMQCLVIATRYAVCRR